MSSIGDPKRRTRYAPPRWRLRTPLDHHRMKAGSAGGERFVRSSPACTRCASRSEATGPQEAKSAELFITRLERSPDLRLGFLYRHPAPADGGTAPARPEAHILARPKYGACPVVASAISANDRSMPDNARSRRLPGLTVSAQVLCFGRSLSTFGSGNELEQCRGFERLGMPLGEITCWSPIFAVIMKPLLSMSARAGNLQSATVPRS